MVKAMFSLMKEHADHSSNVFLYPYMKECLKPHQTSVFKQLIETNIKIYNFGE